jgi:uncharacterized protein YuzE/DNA-binding XRE family transcriptional regulator
VVRTTEYFEKKIRDRSIRREWCQRTVERPVATQENSMRYFYDRDSDSLYLTLAERRKYEESVEAAPGVVLDFDAAGRVIGIDLEHASRVVDVDHLELHEEPSASSASSAKMDGARLKREREAIGVTQAQLGRELSVSPNTIARWERGELRIEHVGMLDLALQALRARMAESKTQSRVAGHVVRATGMRRPKK